MAKNFRPLRPLRGRLIFAAILLAGSCFVQSEEPRTATTERIQYGTPRKIATIQGKLVRESSGLAVSRRRADVFWTHNDAGDEPRIFAFDRQGQMLATCNLNGAAADDWEDMASFVLDGKPYLLLADVGDNRRHRTHHKLYIIEEPTLDQKSADVAQTIRFSYQDGAHDCEAVAVDTTSKTILLCTKVLGLTCEIFQLDLPTHSKSQQTAAVIAKPALTAVTSMDVSPDGLRAIVLTYGDAFEFAREANETWATGFARQPRTIHMPDRKQGEAICYGADGKTLFLTSEQLPTPLWEVPVIAPQSP